MEVVDEPTHLEQIQQLRRELNRKLQTVEEGSLFHAIYLQTLAFTASHDNREWIQEFQNAQRTFGWMQDSNERFCQSAITATTEWLRKYHNRSTISSTTNPEDDRGGDVKRRVIGGRISKRRRANKKRKSRRF
jgi:cell fate (sporulation/competence/biofilm development) regulator YlbF (YheA/YmcA/DUF963 family)